MFRSWLKYSLISNRLIHTVARQENNEKKKVIVLGAGWGGFQFVRYLKRNKYDVTLVSPRNHFLFTPLLPSTTVGTLEFRCIIEPVRTLSNLHYYQAYCDEISYKTNQIHCQDFFNPNKEFSLDYDYLVCCHGANSNTFGIPGVEQHAFFLKQLSDARAIRNRLMELFERASNRFISEEERKALTTFVIVGGGPTSIEFSGELHDFIVEDVAKWFPDVKTRVIVVESTDHILGTFDSKLTDYAMNILKSRSEITLKTNTYVKRVDENEVLLSNGEVIRCGITVWSTGLSPTKLTSTLQFSKEKRSGRLYTNDHLQVLVDDKTVIDNMFALGDCATPINQSLPATAQVAVQEAKYLAHRLNQKEFYLKNSNDITTRNYPVFSFSNAGMLAYLGGYGGLADLKQTKATGFLSWLLWRSVYLTRLVSFKNRLLVAMFWFKSFVFGRDISRF
ncbi:unnamed protein product [Rotaria sordida]|uniref:FAD/NAD(P)-binding domain-containing protein n=1 Tax=Rotaria sordida TaxID=392033 RepID=A0A814J6R2_9BILA|nr:unnamed protein product [Rotaria sordida]CAF1050106.1 unnamed protein product [Rotaria sordida]CAF3545318.1 unnamed protein product [Rotaria sordida]CAF3552772.1 unnamed protein product [Rotaria sordida]